MSPPPPARTEDGRPDVRATLRRELKARMGARDKLAVAAIRSALAAIENAEAQPLDDTGRAAALEDAPATADVPRRRVTDADARAIVADEIEELATAARQYRTIGQAEEADTVEAQADVLRHALPGPPSPGG